LLFIEGSCDVNNGGCSKDAKCKDTKRGPKCRCKKGFEGDGKTCTGKCTINFYAVNILTGAWLNVNILLLRYENEIQ